LLEVDREHAILDERERESGVELEYVVRHTRGDVLHATERTAALLFDREPDELEDVVLAVSRRRQLGSRHREDRASHCRALEADDESPSGPLRGGHGDRSAVDEDLRAGREPIGIVARILDHEGAVEPVGPADATDLDEMCFGLWPARVGHARKARQATTQGALVAN
jgi:hypothetical protein